MGRKIFIQKADIHPLLPTPGPMGSCGTGTGRPGREPHSFEGNGKAKPLGVLQSQSLQSVRALFQLQVGFYWLTSGNAKTDEEMGNQKPSSRAVGGSASRASSQAAGIPSVPTLEATMPPTMAAVVSMSPSAETANHRASS